MRLTPFLLLLIFALPNTAAAQDPDKKVNFEIGGGYTWTLSDVRDYLGDGYNFNIGLTFEATPTIGIEGLYSFNGLGDKEITLNVSEVPEAPGVPTRFSADMNMQYGTAAVVFKSPAESKVRPYGLTGVGVYYRPINVTTPGVGYVPGYCNPWYYYCVPGGWVPVENVVGERSSTDFGMVFGGGVDFRVGEAASVFVELRYHYIWGPEINPTQTPLTTDSTSTASKANGQFLPFTFGIRF
jgi:opacity protein-like surface antigen